MKILASIFKYLQLAEEIGALIPEKHVQAIDLLLTTLTNELQGPVTQAVGTVAPTVTGISPAQAQAVKQGVSPAQGK